MEQQNKPQIPEKFKLVALVILGLPMAVSYVFTTMQWYPATYVIDKLTDADGKFSLRSAVVINWAIMMLAELVLLVPAALIAAGIRSAKNKKIS